MVNLDGSVRIVYQKDRYIRKITEGITSGYSKYIRSEANGN